MGANGAWSLEGGSTKERNAQSETDFPHPNGRHRAYARGRMCAAQPAVADEGGSVRLRLIDPWKQGILQGGYIRRSGRKQLHAQGIFGRSSRSARDRCGIGCAWCCAGIHGRSGVGNARCRAGKRHSCALSVCGGVWTAGGGVRTGRTKLQASRAKRGRSFGPCG